ncbi:hypothetical protein EV197_1374 [Aquimarina brevivitae]|uniref:Uncharacterized protein n=1 Tax=Aquimarina brevivitae TaxID=323412 RepID=A0A4Q7PJY2_9FLAO|nr:hypothetical protein EV197_1374 [Aquimarina brevivitae]
MVHDAMEGVKITINRISNAEYTETSTYDYQKTTSFVEK